MPLNKEYHIYDVLFLLLHTDKVKPDHYNIGGFTKPYEVLNTCSLH